MEVYKRSGFDKPLALTTLILLSFGLIMVFSSSAVLSNETYGRSFSFFLNQSIGALVGMVLIGMILATRHAFYQSNLFIFGLLVLSILLLALCLLMPAIGNTNRWIIFMGLRFQPSELAKLSLILFFASYIDKKKEKINEFRSMIIPMAVLFLILLLIVKEPDYGTALLVFIICAIMLFIGGLKLGYFLSLGTVSLGFFFFYLFQASYRMERMTAFLNPAGDPLKSGFQAIQSKLAVGAGGLLGVSLGESIQKLFFLPCAHTDYIYAIVGEELGLLGTFSILLLFSVFLWRGLVIARRAPDLFSQLVAAGLTLAVAVQALMNISIVLGLGPATGLPLPLFSFGRSSLVCTLACIGILLHISQRKSIQRKQ